MAKLECELRGSMPALLAALEEAVQAGSLSASYEDGSDFVTPNGSCAVRVYERYSIFGSNRVSLNITLLEADGRVFLSAITSGGSQAVLFKVNTIGEEAFLDTIREVVARYRV